MIKTQPNADRSEGVSKNRKELEKELFDIMHEASKDGILETKELEATDKKALS